MRKDHVASHPSQSILGGKSLTAIEIEVGSAITAPATQETPVSYLEPLSYAEPRPTPKQDIAQSSKKVSVAEDPDSKKSTSFTSMAREKHIKNLEALFDAEADMKKAAEAKNVELVKELEGLRVQFSDLQVNNKQLSQQVSSLQAQVTREERIKAAFEEFKKYEDDKLEKRCAEIDAPLDALSIEIDEELYPHMLTAIVGPEYGVKQGEAKLDLVAIETYHPVADDKYVTALHALKDLKYSLVDQLEKLKDTLLDLIMTSLYLESDTGEDAPQWIWELCPNSSQLTIPVYLKVRDPKDPWGCKEEILLGDAIAANISCVEKKKKCRVVCRTYRVISAHHARSDGVPVSVPTVAPSRPCHPAGGCGYTY
ncbi:hypothetical protein Tco_0505604 [Tanacetum coccineum]